MLVPVLFPSPYATFVLHAATSLDHFTHCRDIAEKMARGALSLTDTERQYW